MSFPIPSPLDWRDAAEAALNGRALQSLMHLDADQLVTRPLYAAATGVQAIAVARPSSVGVRVVLPEDAASRLHRDPISAFAEGGETARPMLEPLTETGFVLASGRVAHEAGGSIAQELAFATGAVVEYVRAGVAAGMTAEAVLKGTVVGLSVDQEVFDGVAKIRAMRLIWRGLAQAFGVETPAVIEARSSQRMLSLRDAGPNPARLTAAGLAAVLGGADEVVLDGVDPRQLVEVQAVLTGEAKPASSDDPAFGSWYLDARTRDFAEAGWAEFQAMEAEGGLIEALQGGIVQPRIARARKLHEDRLGLGAARAAARTPDLALSPVRFGDVGRETGR